MKKGSITVFLALALGLVVSLLCSGLESVKMAAARTQILNGLDIGLYSLFGQYEESLLRDFDLFAIDGTAGGKELVFSVGLYSSWNPPLFSYKAAVHLVASSLTIHTDQKVTVHVLHLSPVFSISHIDQSTFAMSYFSSHCARN